jgi:hypothetical protein
MRKRKGMNPQKAPAAHDWRTTDLDEIARRKIRAQEARFRIVNTDPRQPIHSTFDVHSGEDRRYSVEVRNAVTREVFCSCVDFREGTEGSVPHNDISLRLDMASAQTEKSSIDRQEEQ